ncbi:DNA polymerase III subunit gamma/tau [Pseudoduganella umbonata]|uniref:DNA polymerase III subunit gamma/tau n=1 Tax=Pseudoduganella umbonata TaxID=864828 RepID=A0A4P8HYH0_9BURK|nr:DNA polymerase III subunit gamma/tau [Pseudoduganella umbonata]MBB3224118.1 DNA polymerase-3 subunit gamma/tau [Pseudoduganella umbonata]QCP14018.1 DNA polymerase III subunit gamma/tau [Pseudoduganella umbonata]
MSYQVLARKYRPRNFETLVGQEHVVRALTHALGTGRLHHAYLFTGTRGVGKTTLSRILAKSLNCTGPDGNGGITATPCGACEACRAIDGGRFVDYIEMDAASNRGVDEMAQLLEQAIYAPSNARFKVYMIDEVHMLTNHAFNAMLKTLEEPPEHVKFILATTDPQKIPVTVLSRCLQFNLKQMPPGHIVGHLENILGQEGVTFEQPALRLLAQGAHGSMRDALSLTDQAIAYAAGAVTLEAVQGMLGALDQSYLVRLLDALANRDGSDLMAVADEMASRSLSYNGALQDLGTLLHRIALAQTVPAAVPEDLPEYADIIRLAAAFDAEEVQLYYQIAVHGRNELGLAPDEYAGFSMTLLRMLAFRPGVGGAEAAPGGAPANTPVISRPAAGGSPARAAAAAATSAGVSATAPAAPQAAAAPRAAGASVGQAAASHAAVSHAAAAPAPAAAAPAAPRAAVFSPPAPAPAPAPASSAPAAAARPSGPVSPARAAINAALEAARAATLARTGARPPMRTAAPEDPALSAPSAPAPQAAAPAKPLPWEDARPQGDAAVLEAPPAVQPQARPASQEDDDLPPWVTEFSDDSAVAAPAQRVQNRAEAPAQHRADVRAEAPAQHRADAREAPAAPAVPAAPVRQTAPAQAPYAYVVTPVPELDWDGNWPLLAAHLPLRGVAQQLATQAELIECKIDGNAAVFHLRCPIDTWRTPPNVEKLTAALAERFNRPARVETELGPVWFTTAAEQQAHREACQRQAEDTVHNDPFVQAMVREFGAFVVPGSIVAPITPAH